jgi:DNA-binding transcriptional MerR regulator
MQNQPRVATVGEVATLLGVPLHRVDYAIRSRGIVATVTAGGRRLYGDDAIEVIAKVLGQITERREVANVG